MKYLILGILLNSTVCFGQSSTSPALEVGNVHGYEFHWSVGDVLGPIANHSVVLLPSNIDLEPSDALTIDSLNLEVSIYPNPSSSFVNVRGKELGQISVVDANGKIQNIRMMNTDEDHLILDISSLLPGLYFVILDVNSHPLKWKMLVK